MASKQNKRKTAMVLYQLEESLGDFLIENSSVEIFNDSRIKAIADRELKSGRSVELSSVADIVEATYLDEIFHLALESTKDQSINDSLKYLYNLFVNFSVFSIRNAIAHPNRPFLDSYWYRVAAIASDPVIEIVRLPNIKETLAAAEAGNIMDPPEDWFSAFNCSIPNNLPSQFDHALTGLVGRKKDQQRLEQALKTDRVHTVAIVAPGGIGKTALALDCLSNLVSLPETGKWVDTVIFVSMKTEKLTIDGLTPLQAVETLDQIKTTVSENIAKIYENEVLTFEETCKKYENHKILLFLDNLETLLRDSPQTFDEFNMLLPGTWRVLVTSRISISNAYIISLNELEDKSAQHLARLYYARRGGDVTGEDNIRKIVKSCFCNPLAIRLTLDLVLKGSELPDSINVANKQIAEFSYNNLIQALTINSIKILEAIFVEDTSTRLSLCEILSMSIDEVADSISELTRTSLINRNINGEKEEYQLNNSVRDLLLQSPRNIEVRNDVQNKIRKRRQISQDIDIKQAENQIHDFHYNYIPVNTNENLKILVKDLNHAFKGGKLKTELAISFYKRFSEASILYESDYIFQRSYARILDQLKDSKNAELHFKKALDIKNNDFATMYLLGRLYHRANRFEDAEPIFEYIAKKDLAELIKENKIYAEKVLGSYYSCLLYQHKYDEVLSCTKKWKESGDFCGIMGSFRASAWKRKMENIVDSSPKQTVDALLRASRIMNEVVEREGYIYTACIQSLKIFQEIEFCFGRRHYQENFAEQGHELLKFIDKHLMEITRVFDKYSPSQALDFAEKLRSINIGANPFHDRRWKIALQSGFSDGIDQSEAIQKGMIIAEVVNIPSKYETFPSFIFCEDAGKERYFVHFSTLRNGTWSDWTRVREGYSLALEPDKFNRKPEKAIRAEDSYLIN